MVWKELASDYSHADASRQVRTFIPCLPPPPQKVHIGLSTYYKCYGMREFGRSHDILAKPAMIQLLEASRIDLTFASGAPCCSS